MYNFDEIKKYWETRASNDSSAQSTTQDFYLREIEFNTVSKHISTYQPKTVADIGCGDGRTTLRLAKEFPSIKFYGFDYSETMIANAKQLIESNHAPNVEFQVLDICNTIPATFDCIYTTRCLINLPTWELQKQAISNIHQALSENGIYFMIENFKEGHDNFNQIRKNFGLPEIAIREHNKFFERDRFLHSIKEQFSILKDINISSTYYLVSRVIYSKMCAESGQQPDYFDDHHRYATGLPFSGEYGPVRLFGLRKLGSL